MPSQEARRRTEEAAAAHHAATRAAGRRDALLEAATALDAEYLSGDIDTAAEAADRLREMAANQQVGSKS